MKAKVVYSRFKKTYNNRNYQILVYGELTETKSVDGFYIVPVTFNGKCNKVKDIDMDGRRFVKGYNKFYSATKSFNMGWAICAEPDTFNYDEGVKICKRRFPKSPMTTQNGRYLTPDMCQAIVDNEAKYIANHIEMFLPKTDEIEIVSNDNMETYEDFQKKVDNIVKDIFDNASASVNNHVCGCVDKCKCKDEDNTHYFEPRKGDYVKWTHNGRKYLGIMNWESVSEGVCEEQRNKFFFHAPINESNGLISHDESVLFGEINVPLNNRLRFMKVTDNDKCLIDNYLKGGLRMKWDGNKFNFVICVDCGE